MYSMIKHSNFTSKKFHVTNKMKWSRMQLNNLQIPYLRPQSSFLVSPTESVVVFPVHFRQDVDPWFGWYSPIRQSLHDSLSVGKPEDEYVPGIQRSKNNKVYFTLVFIKWGMIIWVLRHWRVPIQLVFTSCSHDKYSELTRIQRALHSALYKRAMQLSLHAAFIWKISNPTIY
jgi:hypothetical protein